jgi:hypothetical protein
MPRQARFADGGLISDATVAQIDAVASRHVQLIDWEPGDVVLVDNLRFAHGRAPYTGRRAVHVAMGMACTTDSRDPLFDC